MQQGKGRGGTRAWLTASRPCSATPTPAPPTCGAGHGAAPHAAVAQQQRHISGAVGAARAHAQLLPPPLTRPAGAARHAPSRALARQGRGCGHRCSCWPQAQLPCPGPLPAQHLCGHAGALVEEKNALAASAGAPATAEWSAEGPRALRRQPAVARPGARRGWRTARSAAQHISRQSQGSGLTMQQTRVRPSCRTRGRQATRANRVWQVGGAVGQFKGAQASGLNGSGRPRHTPARRCRSRRTGMPPKRLTTQALVVPSYCCTLWSAVTAYPCFQSAPQRMPPATPLAEPHAPRRSQRRVELGAAAPSRTYKVPSAGRQR